MRHLSFPSWNFSGLLALMPRERHLGTIKVDTVLLESFSNMHEGFVGVKMEHHYGLHHEDDFGGTHMVDVMEGHSPHHSPSNEYDYQFGTANIHLDAMYDRPMHPQFSSPQPLHPLVTMPQWPSQITNPSETSPPTSTSQHRPILPLSKTSDAVPKIAVPPAPEKKPAHTTSTSRRTLTDSDRRRMCEYHNDNPSVKQTEIGGECHA